MATPGDTATNAGIWGTVAAIVVFIFKGGPQWLSSWWAGRNGATTEERLTLETLNTRFNQDNLYLRGLLAERDATVDAQRVQLDRQQAHINNLNRNTQHQGVRIAELMDQLAVLTRQLAAMQLRIEKVEEHDTGTPGT